MADPILAFRTITTCFLSRWAFAGSPPVLTQYPIALPANPENFEVTPGIELQDIEQTGCTGENQIIYTYPTKTVPEIKLDFGLATPEIESLIIGRLAETVTNHKGWVYFDGVLNSTTVAAKAAGKWGADVLTQAAATSKALVYYIDPETKLAKQISIVDATPTGDQMMIEAGLELTFSSALAATGYNYYGWVPSTHAAATILGSKSIPQVSVYATGICFDDTIREFTAAKCSIRPQGSLPKDVKRSVSLRILADPESTTGMGYSIAYLPDLNDC